MRYRASVVLRLRYTHFLLKSSSLVRFEQCKQKFKIDSWNKDKKFSRFEPLLFLLLLMLCYDHSIRHRAHFELHYLCGGSNIVISMRGAAQRTRIGWLLGNNTNSQRAHERISNHPQQCHSSNYRIRVTESDCHFCHDIIQSVGKSRRSVLAQNRRRSSDPIKRSRILGVSSMHHAIRSLVCSTLQQLESVRRSTPTSPSDANRFTYHSITSLSCCDESLPSLLMFLEPCLHDW